MTIFDYLTAKKPTERKDKPIRLIELFAGIGAQAAALERLNVDFEHYRAIEFDRFAVQSYNAIHGTDFTPTDIQTVKGADLGITDTDRYLYIMTYSFPCQDLSVAGRKRGMTKGTGTRSGLLWEVERLLQETNDLPQILLMENVTQVHSKKNAPDFEKWLNFLQDRGYTNYTADLNAEDYGIAQHRIRTFVVSFLDGGAYSFPDPKPLETTIVDYLEQGVGEKYYITTPRADDMIRDLVAKGDIFQGNQIAVDLCEQDPTPVDTASCIRGGTRHTYRGLRE